MLKKGIPDGVTLSKLIITPKSPQVLDKEMICVPLSLPIPASILLGLLLFAENKISSLPVLIAFSNYDNKQLIFNKLFNDAFYSFGLF